MHQFPPSAPPSAGTAVDTSQEHRRWARVLEQTAIGIAIVDPVAQTLQFVNPAFARMHGYAIGELSGLPIAQLLPPGLRAGVTAAIAETHRLGQRSFESQHQRRNGEVFPVLIDATAMHEDDDTEVYCIVNVRDITPLVAAREELRLRQEFFQRTFTDAPVGMAIADRDGRYLCVNATMCAMTGYSEAELLGLNYRDITHPDDIAENDQRRGELLDGRGANFAMEKRYLHKNGSEPWALMVVSAINGPDGQAVVTIGQMLDIDRLKRTKTALRESEELLNDAQHMAHIGSWKLDFASGDVVWSDELYRLFGIVRDAVTPSHDAFVSFVHPDDRHLTEAACMDSQARGEPYQFSHRLQLRDGSIKWVVEKGRTELDARGEPRRAIGTVQDITEQKYAEIALQESVDLLHTIIDTAPLRVFWKDRDSRFLGCNPAFARDAGLASPQALVGRDDRDMAWARHAAAFRADDAEVMHSGQAKLGYEEPLTTADGHTITVATSKVPLRNHAQEVIGVLGIYQDITRSKRHEREAIEAREKIRALAAHHEQMLEEERKRIAHEIHDELGQQLSALKMDLAMLRRARGGDAELDAIVQRMRDSVDRSIRVVRHVASNLHPAALDHGIVAAIEWLAGEFAGRSGIACTFDAGDGEFTLGGMGAITVFRVVQESLTNVARHAEASRVAIVARRNACELELVVQDNGSGFDPAVVAAKAGYGLFGMRERVLAQGGTIRFDSQPGAGTTVRITLPLTAP